MLHWHEISGRSDFDDLPPQLRGEYLEVVGPSMAAGESMRAWGSRYARLVFERCGRNKRRACRQLDISYHTLEAYLRYTQQDADANKQLPAWVRSASTTGDVPSATTVHEGPPEA